MTPTAQRSRGAVLLRGLLSLVGILLIVIGLPVALAVLGGNPLPSEIPSMDEVLSALSRPDDGTLLIAVITVIGWGVWATLALSFLVEIPAAIRGVPAPRLPGLSWQQGRAAAMVGAVAAMLAIGAAGAVPASASTTTVDSVSAPSTAATQQAGDTTADGTTAEGGAGGGVVTVRSGDTLWGIAEDHLGGGEHYPELVESTEGLTQADGGALTSPDEIRPGWQVMVPSADEPSSPVQPVSHDTPDTDTTTPDAAPVIADLDAEMGGTGGDAGGAGGGDTGADTMATADASGLSASTTVPVQQTADPSSRQIVEGDAPGTSATTGLGVLAGAGLLAFVEARRRRQRRSRRPGWRLVLPSDAAARAEGWVRALADTRGHADLDAALAELSARCGPGAVPSLRAARLGESEIELYVVEETLELPPPWVSAGGGTWVLDRRRITAVGDALPTAWPSLVTIGEDEDRARIFMNLDEIGALELHGESDETESVLAALAVDLATAEPSRRRVTVVGPLADLVEALDDPRVTHTSDVASVLTRLEAVGGALTGESEVLLLGAALGREEIRRLRALMEGAPRGTLSVVSTTRGVADWSLSVEGRHEGLSAVLAPVGMALRPAALTRPGYDELLALLRSTGQAAVPGPEWTAGAHPDPLTTETVPRRRVPAAPGPADEATTNISQLRTDRASHVRVLGRVEVTGLGAPPRDEAGAAELATLLALHPGSDRAGAAAALQLGDEALGWTLHEVDRWLGHAGAPGVVADGDRYALGDALLDWQQLRALIGSALATADTDKVRAALTLVTAAPFDGTPEGRYGWARADRWEMCAAVADIAHELAQRSLRAGDPETAAWAADKGLLAEPLSEALWRDALHASWQAEDPERARLTASGAQEAMGDLGSLAEDSTHVVERLEARA